MELFETGSNWIIALGKTLLHSFWIGLALLGLLKFLFLAIPRSASGTRYNLATATLLLFAGFLASLFLWLYTPDTINTSLVPPGFISSLQVTFSMETPGDWLDQVCYYGTWGYFSGIVLIVVRLALGGHRMQLLRKDSRPPGQIWIKTFRALVDETGTGLRARLAVSDHADTPMLSGIFKPMIIVPASMISNLPFSQVEAILLHEIFHLKRHDHLLNVVQGIIETLFFFNPALRSISRIVRTEREICCDDLVLGAGRHPMDYAKALYLLAADRRQSPEMVTAATGSHRDQLKLRIERILNPKTMKTNIRDRFIAFLLLAGGIVAVTLLAGFTSGLTTFKHQGNPVTSIFVDPTSLKSAARDTIPGQATVHAGAEPVVAPVPVQVPDPMAIPDPESVTEPVAVPEPEVAPEPASVLAPEPVTAQDPDQVPEKDWEKIRKEMEEAMAEIDWEQIKRDMKEAKHKALEEIDWEEIKKEMEKARQEAMEEIDWEQIKREIKEAKRKALEEIDWEEIKKEMEELKSQSMETIDWEELKDEMAQIQEKLGEWMESFEYDFDFDMEDLDIDLEVPEVDIDIEKEDPEVDIDINMEDPEVDQDNENDVVA